MAGQVSDFWKWIFTCSALGMTIKKVSYEELLSEYRYSLGIWTETKALYSSDGPEVFYAALALEALEKQLEKHRQPISLRAAA